MALGPRNHQIPLEAAAALTKRHRDAKTTEIKSGAFHKDQILELLNQQGCVGLRIHLGREPDGNPTVVLTGIDGANNDLTTATLETWWPCPPYCGAANTLNS